MITIGHNRINVPPPLGMTSFALQQRILPVAGRVIGSMLHHIGGQHAGDLEGLMGRDVMDVLPSALPALGEVFSSMPPGELESLTRILLRDAKYYMAAGPKDGAPLFGGGSGTDAFDALFQGRHMDVWKLLWHALGVWYPDFFALASGFRASTGGPGAVSSESTTSAPSGPAGA